MEDIRLSHIIYRTVELNPGITENQLVWLICSSLDFEESEVKLVLERLKTNQVAIPKCLDAYFISKQKTKKGYDIIKYSPTKKNRESVAATLDKYQTIHQYLVPELLFKR